MPTCGRATAPWPGHTDKTATPPLRPPETTNGSALAEQGAEAGLLEVVVAGQRVGQAALGHHQNEMQSVRLQPLSGRRANRSTPRRKRASLAAMSSVSSSSH